jgi:hypothetical protein
MAKRTKKFVAAQMAATNNGLGFRLIQEHQDDLYRALEAVGYQWNPDAGLWIKLLDQPAEPPSDLIRIRIWAEARYVEGLADVIANALKPAIDAELIERSAPYPCRPPKQKESRVYLTLRLFK